MTDESFPVEVFWAKSNAGGAPHSLIGHLLDTAAVAELIWDEFLAPKVQEQINSAAAGRGRDLMVLLAGFHDLGKATPAFQLKAPPKQGDVLLGRLRDHLSVPAVRPNTFDRWPHPHGSVVIAEQCFRAAEMRDWEWLLPILDGHHGRFGSRPSVNRHGLAHGAAPTDEGESWRDAQYAAARAVSARAGVSLAGWELSAPTRGVQLAMSGLLVMADWIASSDFFTGQGLVDQSMDQARTRAQKAWQSLGLIRGWRTERLIQDPAEFPRRFPFAANPAQEMLISAAAAQSAPGLMIMEAPMGEGKTEAALAAAEVLARRHGCSGLVFAMPTQGTTDAMFARVQQWLASVDPLVAPSLLHGRSMLNEKWVELLEGQTSGGSPPSQVQTVLLAVSSPRERRLF